ncbi:uncharacterized protein LOC121829519 [Peromyscus maniculatus bairdii]|uniref:uncharacterized protein LOC121829519 n=1 Tax=Peromyscus maniculatus bairdii TaxID=230844 RepID=UPI003FCF4586
MPTAPVRSLVGALAPFTKAWHALYKMQNVLCGLVCADSVFPAPVPQPLNPTKPFRSLPLRLRISETGWMHVGSLGETWSVCITPKRFWYLLDKKGEEYPLEVFFLVGRTSNKQRKHQVSEYGRVGLRPFRKPMSTKLQSYTVEQLCIPGTWI